MKLSRISQALTLLFHLVKLGKPVQLYLFVSFTVYLIVGVLELRTNHLVHFFKLISLFISQEVIVFLTPHKFF